MYYELDVSKTIAGLPVSYVNPIFSKDIFIKFIPAFQNFIDANNGVIEKIVNSTTVDTVITDTESKLSFNSSSDLSDLSVLTIDSNNDIILGKSTATCYRSGYDSDSVITITDTSGSDNKVTVSYLLDDVLIKTVKIDVLADTQVSESIELTLTSTGDQTITITINDENNSATLNSFVNTITSNFAAPNGDGTVLWETFCDISDQKILKNVWNSDWEFAMSLCIGHYISLINRETQKSFGLGDIAKDSDPKGLTTQVERTKIDYKNVILSSNESKFWNSTEYGRILITLLSTKTIPTMIVVN